MQSYCVGALILISWSEAITYHIGLTGFETHKNRMRHLDIRSKHVTAHVFEFCFAWSFICLQIYLKSYRLQSNEVHPHGIAPLTVANTEVCRYFWYSSGFVSVSLRSCMEIVTGRDLWLLIYRFCIWHWRRDYFCWLVWCGCLVFVLQDSYRLTESEVFQVMTLAKLYSFSSNKWLLFKADTSATEVSARRASVMFWVVAGAEETTA